MDDLMDEIDCLKASERRFARTVYHTKAKLAPHGSRSWTHDTCRYCGTLQRHDWYPELHNDLCIALAAKAVIQDELDEIVRTNGASFPLVIAGNIVKLELEYQQCEYYLVIRFPSDTGTQHRLVSIEAGTMWSHESLWGGLHPFQVQVVTDQVCLKVN